MSSLLPTVVFAFAAAGCAQESLRESRPVEASAAITAASDDVRAILAEGRNTFRHETFGDEHYWTDTARMHEVVRDSLSPSAALKAGLKVDAEALPAELAQAIRSGKVDLESPATTVALLKLDAVLGLKGTVEKLDGKDTLVRLGITCALCHSTVDDSFSPGIGRRLDGWPNRDLDVGALIALSPAIPAEQKVVYNSWGPGKYDPRYNLDGKSTPLVIPPAYGLADVTNETYTGEGPISYWNAYVAVTQMHGLGNFADPRLGIDVKNSPDRVTPRLAALRTYQHSLVTPSARHEDLDPTAAERGRAVFSKNCQKCHVGSAGTDNDAGVLHEPSETGMNADYALRTANKRYRTTPLRGLGQHPPYFHDGSAQTLKEVVEHYDRVLELKLERDQAQDLVEYLKTL